MKIIIIICCGIAVIALVFVLSGKTYLFKDTTTSTIPDNGLPTNTTRPSIPSNKDITRPPINDPDSLPGNTTKGSAGIASEALSRFVDELLGIASGTINDSAEEYNNKRDKLCELLDKDTNYIEAAYFIIGDSTVDGRTKKIIAESWPIDQKELLGDYYYKEADPKTKIWLLYGVEGESVFSIFTQTQVQDKLIDDLLNSDNTDLRLVLINKMQKDINISRKVALAFDQILASTNEKNEIMFAITAFVLNSSDKHYADLIINRLQHASYTDSNVRIIAEQLILAGKVDLNTNPELYHATMPSMEAIVDDAANNISDEDSIGFFLTVADYLSKKDNGFDKKLLKVLENNSSENYRAASLLVMQNLPVTEEIEQAILRLINSRNYPVKIKISALDVLGKSSNSILVDDLQSLVKSNDSTELNQKILKTIERLKKNFK